MVPALSQAQMPGYPPGMQIPVQPTAYAPPGYAPSMAMPAYAPPPMTGGPACGPACGPMCAPGGDCYPGMSIPSGVSHSGNVINYRVNRHGDRWNETQPIEAFLTQIGRRSWLRLEYLNWDFEDPTGSIGAPLLNNDGRTPFLVEDNVDGDQFGFAIVPNFDNVTLNDVAGIRGTYGIWFDGGSIEFSVFGTDQASDEAAFLNLQANRPDPPDPNDPNPPPPNAGLGTQSNPNIIIPLTVDGIASDATVSDPTVPVALAFLGFDESYRATLRSQIWGGELNVLSKPSPSTNGFTWQWLGGMRYMSFDESFGQVGTSDGGGAFIPVTTRIRSSASNNLYGPTAGFRMQLASKYLTLSATPRITMGLNDYTSRLATSTRDPNGIISQTIISEEEVDFTTLTQVSFLAEVHCSEAFTIFGGYDFFWSHRVARPFRSVVYDSTVNVDTLEPLIGLNSDPESLALEGFSFGAVIRF